MKNIFLIKKIKCFFSFGKDSFYNLFNCFYKKNNFCFFNFNFFKIKKINFLYIFNFFIKIKNIKKYNELIMRKIRFSCLKNYDNSFFLKNHHYFDKLEFLIYNFLKKKKIISKNIWYKKNYIFKPYINFFLKKYFSLIDKSNKNISIKRNFIRCLLNFV